MDGEARVVVAWAGAVDPAHPAMRGAVVAGRRALAAAGGEIIANLSFGFWRYLSSKAHEKSLWMPYLHAAFSPKTNRGDVDARVGRLHGLRNRVAHHEPLLSTNILTGLDDLLWVATRLDPSIAQYISASSDVRTSTATVPEQARPETTKHRSPRACLKTDRRLTRIGVRPAANVVLYGDIFNPLVL
ncbi:MAG: hypothetical protein ABSH36_14580 [Solirubrobacteraceae bacterium]